MATVAPVFISLPPHDGSCIRYQWTLTGTDDGAPVNMVQWADRTVQFEGAFGGGTVVFEGSNNDGTNYQVLTDAQAVAISKTASGLEQVVEITQLARPRASVGVTSVVVSMVLRRQQALRI
jgi:hypothetical protein